MRLGGKFTLRYCWENCYKVALMNQRKPIRKHWSRPRLKGGGHSSYVNCTNSLTNTNNSPVSLHFVCSNFKEIEEICKSEPDNWK